MRRSSVLNIAVGPSFLTCPYYIANQWSGLKKFARPDILEGHRIHGSLLTTVRTVPLIEVLRIAAAPEIIDYFSLDVEGAEYAILDNYFSYAGPKFRCMTIEVGTNQDDLGRLATLLTPYGYRLDKVCAWESYWVNPELLREDFRQEYQGSWEKPKPCPEPPTST